MSEAALFKISVENFNEYFTKFHSVSRTVEDKNGVSQTVYEQETISGIAANTSFWHCGDCKGLEEYSNKISSMIDELEKKNIETLVLSMSKFEATLINNDLSKSVSHINNFKERVYRSCWFDSTRKYVNDTMNPLCNRVNSLHTLIYNNLHRCV